MVDPKPRPAAADSEACNQSPMLPDHSIPESSTREAARVLWTGLGRWLILAVVWAGCAVTGYIAVKTHVYNAAYAKGYNNAVKRMVSSDSLCRVEGRRDYDSAASAMGLDMGSLPDPDGWYAARFWYRNEPNPFKEIFPDSTDPDTYYLVALDPVWQVEPGYDYYLSAAGNLMRVAWESAAH